MKKLFNFSVKWEPLLKLAGEPTDDMCAGSANQKPETIADDYDVFLYRPPWHQKVMRYSKPHNKVCLRNCICGCRGGLGDKELLKKIRNKDWFPPTYFEGEDCGKVIKDKELYYLKHYTLEAGSGIFIRAGNRLDRVLKRSKNKVPKNKLLQRNLDPHLFNIDYNGSHPKYIDKDFYKDKKYSIRLWTLVSDQGDIAIMKDYHYKFAIFNHKTRDEIIDMSEKLGHMIQPNWFHLTNSTHTRDIKMRYSTFQDLEDSEKFEEIKEWWEDPLGHLKAQHSMMKLNDDPNFFDNYDKIYPLMCQYIKEYIDEILHIQEIPKCIEGRTWTAFGMDFMLDKNKKLYFLEANLDPGYKLFEPSGDWYKEWWGNISNLIRKDDTSMWTMLKSNNKMTVTEFVDNNYDYEDDARGHGFDLMRSECSYPGADPW